MPGADPITSLSLVDRLSGLSSSEAAARLAAQGANILPRGASRSILSIIAETLKEPMLALLLLGGGVYLLLGDRAEALILLAFASFSVLMTVFQESRTEHVLAAMRDLSAPRAMVVRDGVVTRIAGTDIVVGDVMVLQQGDRVAADAVLLEAIDLEVDESLLTGESIAVGKRAAAPEEPSQYPRPGGDDQPCIFAGTIVTRGSGRALVTATGARSEIGRIGLSLATLADEPPRLRVETLRVVRLCGIGAGIVALAVVMLFGSLRGSWIDAILAGIAIGMSMLPEEFPVVLTVFLAMGAWRIAKAGVLTRRAAAIEALGAATVLCTDKTGTLTENRMAIAGLWLPGGETARIAGEIASQSAPFHALIDAGALASAPAAVDPMEIAFHQARAEIAGREAAAGWTLVHSYGLSEDLLAMSNIWRPDGDGADCIVAAKGAPEAIASLCRLPEAEHRAMTAAVKAMAEQGIRVLGVARADTAPGDWPASQRDHAFRLLGLVGLADPVRQSVPAAIAECRRAGIRVMMITGDHALTARAIATQAGIEQGEVMTGQELAMLDDAALALRLKTVSVFARVMPDQKLRIVDALKAAGEVVAMTGDGVNDAPSLKAAHIGISMGRRGTDVAREAAAIVLLDDDFGSIVRAVRLGRRIYDNIRKAMGFIFAVHVPIAGLALLPLLTGLPLLFGPIHIAILEMIIDPVCATVFEAEREEADIMDRPPRDSEARLFTWASIGWSVIWGGVGFLLLAAIFLIASLGSGLAEAQVRGMTFFALIGVIVALILASRSSSASLWQALRGGNPMLRYILAAIAGFAALTAMLPWLAGILGFRSLHGIEIAVALATGTVLLVLLEQLKRLAARVALPAWLGRS